MSKGDIEVKITLPEIIRRYIEEKDMTQTAFAGLIDVDPASLSRLLSGESYRIDVRTLAKIEKARRDGLIDMDVDYGNLFRVEESA